MKHFSTEMCTLVQNCALWDMGLMHMGFMQQGWGLLKSQSLKPPLAKFEKKIDVIL